MIVLGVMKLSFWCFTEQLFSDAWSCYVMHNLENTVVINSDNMLH